MWERFIASLVLLAVFLLAACGDQAPREPAPAPPANTAGDITAPAESTPDSLASDHDPHGGHQEPGDVLRLGEAGTTEAGLTVAVHDLIPLDPEELNLSIPTAGRAFYALDIEACGTEPALDEHPFNPFDLAIEMADGRELSRTVGLHSPELNLTAVGPAECARGWVTFMVPPQVDPAVLHYRPHLDSAVRWELSP